MSNLADKFAPAAKTPDRSAGLAGLLPPTGRRPAPAPTEPDTDQHQPTPSPATAAQEAAVETASPPAVTDTPPSRQPKVAKPAASRSSGTSGTDSDQNPLRGDEIVRIPVYVDAELRKLLREAKQRPNMPTYGAVAVEAFSRHNTESLKELFEQPELETGEGIPRPPAPVGPPKGGSEVQLHLRADQVAWIEDQRHQCAVSSRSHFIAAVLAAYLRSRK